MGFRDSSDYEEAIETPNDYLWWTARVLCTERDVFLYGFILYSATGARTEVGYTVMRSVFRHIEGKAMMEGFMQLRLQGVRVKRGKPDRILFYRRVLS